MELKEAVNSALAKYEQDATAEVYITNEEEDWKDKFIQPCFEKDRTVTWIEVEAYKANRADPDMLGDSPRLKIRGEYDILKNGTSTGWSLVTPSDFNIQSLPEADPIRTGASFNGFGYVIYNDKREAIDLKAMAQENLDVIRIANTQPEEKRMMTIEERTAARAAFKQQNHECTAISENPPKPAKKIIGRSSTVKPSEAELARLPEATRVAIERNIRKFGNES